MMLIGAKWKPREDVSTRLHSIISADNDSYAVVSVLLSSSSPQTVKNVGQKRSTMTYRFPSVA